MSSAETAIGVRAQVAAGLASLVPGASLQLLDFGPASPTIGFRVRTTATHNIDVIEQLFNWRVAASRLDDESTYDELYCYLGKGPGSFIKAVLGAAAWAGPGCGRPPGWDKNPVTGQWVDGRHLTRSS